MGGECSRRLRRHRAGYSELQVDLLTGYHGESVVAVDVPAGSSRLFARVDEVEMGSQPSLRVLTAQRNGGLDDVAYGWFESMIDLEPDAGASAPRAFFRIRHLPSQNKREFFRCHLRARQNPGALHERTAPRRRGRHRSAVRRRSRTAAEYRARSRVRGAAPPPGESAPAVAGRWGARCPRAAAGPPGRPRSRTLSASRSMAPSRTASGQTAPTGPTAAPPRA